ncbi:MAG: hypothetical protein AB7O28_00405 [Vicinamibacterales bacterium]
MFTRTRPVTKASSVVLVGLLSGSLLSAQYSRPAPAKGAGKNPLTGHLIKTGLYMFSGASNTLLRLSSNGLIVVDGQARDHYDALTEQIDRISDQAIRLLITTDHHRVHTANNTQFAADGTQILAHANVARHLGAANATGAATALPTRTYDDHFSLTLGGIGVQLLHFGKAHTDADSVVYFTNLNVVAVGDLYAATPDPDFAAGGSLVGWGPVLDDVLKLDFDVAVPGTGPPVTRADVVAFKGKIDTLVSRATRLVKQGVPKAQLMTRLQTDDLGWHFAFTGAALDAFYAELSGRP